MSDLPPVFVISLPGSQRREVIQRTLESIDLPFRFWDAVHGGKLSAEQIASVDTDYTQREWGHGLSPGEIGCALSHITLYEHIRASAYEAAIVLEDDACPVAGFKEILITMLGKLPTRAELAYLHHGKAKSWPIKRTLPHGLKLVRYRSPSAKSKRNIISTRGYWLSYKGAIKLLHQAYPVRMPSDYLTGYIQRSGIHAYGVEPNCLIENDSISEIDMISQRQYGGHLQPKA
ncbi:MULTISPECIES: glycosyltransferase family 25 protein [Halomonadaceae]|uniref:glycosyltransferase family 25 protein n=1 Tax=Halomonadaceae TaxID=28256 RepID=UPI0015973A65|nr:MULTISPECIES: glycosyltransferase family 25 protein [unclassified Halomonas]QJQ96539.1 LPS biosynthesis glycosyltransferase [Halomonas sp. PA5]